MYTKMRKILLAIFILFLPIAAKANPKIDWTLEMQVHPIIRIPILAQVIGHSAVLNWTLSTDDTAANCPTGAACSQNVYRASGNCSASSNFQILTNSLSGTYSATTPPVAPPSTYTDATLTPGVWCYAVSFVLNGSESPKVSAQALATPTSPSSLVIVAK